MSANVPPYGTEAYRWWEAGCKAEAQARDEGVTPAGKEVRALVEHCSQAVPDYGEADLARVAYRAYALGDLSLRERLRGAWRVLWGGG